MKRILKAIALILGCLILLLVAYYFTIRQLDKQILLGTDTIEQVESSQESPYLIPSSFLDGERFYVKIPIGKGETMLGFCDTGGGICMIFPNTKNRGNLASKIKTGLLKGVMPMEYILFSDIVEDSLFPKPQPMRNFVVRNPFRSIEKPYLIIPPMEKELEMIIEVQPEMEAFMGQGFFMGKSWTFDYPRQEVWVNTPISPNQISNPNVQKIGFKKDENNVKVFGHPSMVIKVEGEIIDVLFDTGATIVLSEDGKKQFNTDKKTLGGSFIAASIFDKWRIDHPHWKYYPSADLAGDIIEVPIVKIGEYEVGPVLFARRPDKNWSEGMIHSMDKIVKGAIGGSALKELKVTIDYNSELILFER